MFPLDLRPLVPLIVARHGDDIYTIEGARVLGARCYGTRCGRFWVFANGHHSWRLHQRPGAHQSEAWGQWLETVGLTPVDFQTRTIAVAALHQKLSAQELMHADAP